MSQRVRSRRKSICVGGWLIPQCPMQMIADAVKTTIRKGVTVDSFVLSSTYKAMQHPPKPLKGLIGLRYCSMSDEISHWNYLNISPEKILGVSQYSLTFSNLKFKQQHAKRGHGFTQRTRSKFSRTQRQRVEKSNRKIRVILQVGKQPTLYSQNKQQSRSSEPSWSPKHLLRVRHFIQPLLEFLTFLKSDGKSPAAAGCVPSSVAWTCTYSL